MADLIIDSVDARAPDFKVAILSRMIFSPLDLERKRALTGDDIFRGSLTLDQLYGARPALGHGHHRAPMRGSTCAAGTPSAGGVTGAPGHNAGHEIVRDRPNRGAKHLNRRQPKERRPV